MIFLSALLPHENYIDGSLLYPATKNSNFHIVFTQFLSIFYFPFIKELNTLCKMLFFGASAGHDESIGDTGSELDIASVKHESHSARKGVKA